jgi:hypothetical protein
MAWINVFLVALGLIADFSIRSPDERTSDWAISLIVLAIIAVMVGVASFRHRRAVLKSPAVVLSSSDVPTDGPSDPRPAQGN